MARRRSASAPPVVEISREARLMLAAEKSLYSFVRQAWPIVEPHREFIDNWHIGCMCEHLQAMTDLELQRLIINIPPRHSKSLIASVFWFSWVWLQTPGARFLYSSYAESLSSRDSVRCRDIITSPWYQERWGDRFRLKDDQNVKTWFANNHQGYRIATTVGGKGLGHGGDYIVTDDPHKIQEVKSGIRRQGVIDWWTQSMIMRSDNPRTARFLVIMQRLHERDLCGYLLAERLGYEHLCLPARYESRRVVYFLPQHEQKLPKDTVVATCLQRDAARIERARVERDAQLVDERRILGEPEGTPLWKENFGEVELLNWEKNLHEEGTAGQLQQRPSAQAGSIFKRQYYRYFNVQGRNGEECAVWGGDAMEPDRESVVPVRLLRFFQTIDSASTTKKTSAYTAVGTFAVTPQKKLLVWNVWRYRLAVPEIMAALMALRIGPIRVVRPPEGRSIFLPAGPDWPCPLMFQAVEKASSGIGLIQESWAEGNPFYPLSADKDKVARAGPVATLYLAGSVFHRRAAEWLVDYEDELASFPNSEFADLADITSYGGYLLTHEKMLSVHVSDGRLYAQRPEEIAAEMTGYLDSNTVTIPGYGRGGGMTITFDDD